MILLCTQFELRAQDTPNNASPLDAVARFASVLAHIETSHVAPPDQEHLIEGAIRGMVDTLDAHSAYLSPDEYALLRNDTEGQFAGVGIEIDVEDGWLTVAAVMPEGPAERAGLRTGDKFLSIDDHEARDVPLRESVQRMRGEPGTTVRVRVRREGFAEAIPYELRREIIQVVNVEGQLLADSIAYVRIRAFSENTASDVSETLTFMERTLAASQRPRLRGIVLDLRNNPGGLLMEAVRVADLFLDSGVIVSTRGRDGHVLSEARASAPGTLSLPMVVLINHYSASASEIVAAALQDQHRANIVGTRSWGKGSVQNIIELASGGALKLTVSRYYSPSGRGIQAEGVTPDVVVENLSEDALARLGLRPPYSERSLERHLANCGAPDSGCTETAPPTTRAATRNSTREAPATAETPAAFSHDTQARAAISLLREHPSH